MMQNAGASITPGTIGDTLRTAPLPLNPTPSANLPVISNTPAAAARAEDANGGVEITVNRFELRGNTVFSQDQLLPLLSDYLNRPIKLVELYEAADKISQYYATQGYTLASTLVPAQKVSSGTITLYVLEGRIGNVAYEGNRLYSAERLQSFANNTEIGQVYRGRNLESDLSVLNTLPGLNARAVLRPGSSFGTTDVFIQTSEDPQSGAFVVDNYGREAVGQTRFSLQYQLNNPFGGADQLQFLGLRSSDNLLRYGQLQYSLPVTRNGLRLLMRGGYASFEVNSAVPVSGFNRDYSFGLEQNLSLSRRDAVTLGAFIENTQANAVLNNAIGLSDTNLTLLSLKANYQHVYSDSATTEIKGNVSSSFSKNDRAACTTGLQPVCNDQRIKLDVDAQHLQPLFRGLQVVGRGRFVYSPDVLNDTQQFSIGGPDTVRGFPSAELRGDWGYFGSLTLRLPFLWQNTNWAGRVFGDSGVVHRRSDFSHRSLSSVGLGLDASYQRLNAKVDWSVPVGGFTPSEGSNQSRVFASLAVGF